MIYHVRNKANPKDTGIVSLIFISYISSLCYSYLPRFQHFHNAGRRQSASASRSWHINRYDLEFWNSRNRKSGIFTIDRIAFRWWRKSKYECVEQRTQWGIDSNTCKKLREYWLESLEIVREGKRTGNVRVGTGLRGTARDHQSDVSWFQPGRDWRSKRKDYSPL